MFAICSTWNIHRSFSPPLGSVGARSQRWAFRTTLNHTNFCCICSTWNIFIHPTDPANIIDHESIARYKTTNRARGTSSSESGDRGRSLAILAEITVLNSFSSRFALFHVKQLAYPNQVCYFPTVGGKSWPGSSRLQIKKVEWEKPQPQ